MVIRRRLSRSNGGNNEEFGVEVWSMCIGPKYDPADTSPRLINSGPKPLLPSDIVYSLLYLDLDTSS